MLPCQVSFDAKESSKSLSCWQTIQAITLNIQISTVSKEQIKLWYLSGDILFSFPISFVCHLNPYSHDIERFSLFLFMGGKKLLVCSYSLGYRQVLFWYTNKKRVLIINLKYEKGDWFLTKPGCWCLLCSYQKYVRFSSNTKIYEHSWFLSCAWSPVGEINLTLENSP